MAKSLLEYIAQSIDEALPQGSLLNGTDIYMRGWERFQRDCFERVTARERRSLERDLPLLNPNPDRS
jgi:hypothetical protein